MSLLWSGGFIGFLWAAVFSYSPVADTGEIKACRGKSQLQFYSSSTEIKKKNTNKEITENERECRFKHADSIYDDKTIHTETISHQSPCAGSSFSIIVAL